MLHTSTALRRPVTTVMTFVALVIVGLIALRLLPLEEFPDVTFPGMQVIIPYPGSTPEEVEQLITRPVEEALSTLAGIEELRSRSEAEQATFEIATRWLQEGKRIESPRSWLLQVARNQAVRHISQ